MLPVLSREVVEGKQRVAILDQALDSLVVFDAPGFDEGVERGECIVLGRGHPDLLEYNSLHLIGQLESRSESRGRARSGRVTERPASAFYEDTDDDEGPKDYQRKGGLAGARQATWQCEPGLQDAPEGAVVSGLRRRDAWRVVGETSR